MIENPFRSHVALKHSCYGKLDGTEFQLLETGTNASDKVTQVHAKFQAKILHRTPPFTCMGATSVFNQKNYRFSMYHDMCTKETTLALARNLFTFVTEQDAMNSNFTAFIAVFEKPISQNEHDFEKLVWTQLQMLYDEDRRYHDWDTNFSNDINNHKFSYSFAERSFFIIGMHPGSSRIARRFSYPLLVFNASRQFDHLVETNQFDNFVRIIRERDVALQGHINPNLPAKYDYSRPEEAEVRQYSGRAVEKDWQCPLVVHKKKH
ncbi:guanitoxin biosynthesis heme-dependent pre-guanitoxin N-hydroxylase GntA [Nostoc sp.]|uniref:guanitoxin biosynthesis heme-dependent pre-guanitoxin N-hydroxylase GntA n=1 Tax=Nostoc sp. TaxID=1180 RepID=UPI002FF5E5CD